MPRSAVAAFAALALVPGSLNAATITVGAGGNLQGAINAARPGDTIVLAAGATFIGNFTLPAPPGTPGFITIRTAADSRLPLPNRRLEPALHAPLLAKIRSGNGLPAIQTALGAHHWRLELLEITATGSGDEIIRLGRGGSDQSTLTVVAHDLVIDRCYVHGDPVTGRKRGIGLNSASTTIRNSHISDVKATAVDSQAIGGWNGPGPFLIENNYLEASGENVMFGGADPKIPNLVPSDITIRLNHLSKPRAWQLSGQWLVKNLLELKNARRVLVEGNVFENSWRHGQSGIAIVLTPRNQDGTAPWSVVSDVTIRFNIVRHAGGAINVTGSDDNYPSQQARNVRFENNLVYDINTSDGPGRFTLIGRSPASVVMEHNTIFQADALVHVYGQRSNGSYEIVSGFRFANNLALHNASGIFGDAAGGFGLTTINAYFSGVGVVSNVLAGGDASRYPAGNLFPTVVAFTGGFVTGTYRLRADSPYKGAGTDGEDLGADLTQLEALTNRALSGNASGAAIPTSPVNLRVTR